MYPIEAIVDLSVPDAMRKMTDAQVTLTQHIRPEDILTQYVAVEDLDGFEAGHSYVFKSGPRWEVYFPYDVRRGGSRDFVSACDVYLPFTYDGPQEGSEDVLLFTGVLGNVAWINSAVAEQYIAAFRVFQEKQ